METPTLQISLGVKQKIYVPSLPKTQINYDKNININTKNII